MGLFHRKKKLADEDEAAEQRNQRPEDTDIKQQRLKAWNPILTPKSYLAVFTSMGIVFLALGLALDARSNKAIVMKKQYDGPGTPASNKNCKIQVADAGVSCQVVMNLDEKMEGPLHVFYEIENFYQNHRRYVKSLSWAQLNRGKNLKKKDLNADCKPLVTNNSKVLNPCGVVANTLFNDVITLAQPADLVLKEDNIAWESDVRELYTQPQGFQWKTVDAATTQSCTEGKHCPEDLCRAESIGVPCAPYVCRGSFYDQYKSKSGGTVKCDAGTHVLFHYARPQDFQYLYETFPQVISPIVGVRNEHFAVWMRTAALPHFRKLYGRITETLKKDTTLVFNIENNFDVHAFGGKKYLVVSTTKAGFELGFLAVAYLVVGIACLGIAMLFATLQCISPRRMGDIRYIPWLR